MKHEPHPPGARPANGNQQPLEIFTIGHSTHVIDEFVGLLRAYGIRRVVDVRTIPRSRSNPQFNHEDFSHTLHNHGIHYRHMKALGGLRHPRADSPNTAWRNDSFRGYADYMQTPAFTQALEELITLAAEEPTVIMCAEAVPWRCHRSLIGDALLVRGVVVRDIFSATKSSLHTMTPFAKVDGQQVMYPGGDSA